jgi:hypothetical protein
MSNTKNKIIIFVPADETIALLNHLYTDQSQDINRKKEQAEWSQLK